MAPKRVAVAAPHLRGDFTLTLDERGARLRVERADVRALFREARGIGGDLRLCVRGGCENDVQKKTRKHHTPAPCAATRARPTRARWRRPRPRARPLSAGGRGQEAA